MDQSYSGATPEDIRYIHYDKASTALGYQATANQPGTIAFGHDAGDESGYTYEWETLTDEKGNPKQNEIDGTTNDYTKAPKSIKKKAPYTSAYYNRLVKVADGIDDHDVVVMEQLKQYAEKDASNLGNNIKVYKTDEKGNVQLGKDKQPVEDKGATTTAQKNSKDAWGTALGADTFSEGTPEKATDASTSDQLVTGKTLYNYDAPVAETGKKLNYVSANNTTGQNLLNLDRQVKTNTDTLSDVNSRSVKYDTKTENGKTVVDNTKITLAGEGGTTITNLKDGVKNNDAATVGQLDDRISGVTYEAGNGIDMSNKKISAVAGTGITVNAKGINVNTGKHLSVNTSGKVDVDDNGEVAAEDGNLVTGKTVYDALHGGLDNITVGKDGQNGKDGSIGIAGQNGKDGYSITYIKTEQGAAGVDGKDGITRVVYQDKDGNGKHTFATLDDGLKFKGDDSTIIAKKLNEQLNITGGADSTKLTDKNIGVNSSTDGLKIQLAKDLTSITSISGSTDDKGAKITLDTTDTNISVNGGSIKDVATNLDKDGNIISGNENNAANMSDVQTLVQQGVDNGYINGDGITIQKDGTSGKNVISVNQGDGLTVDEATKALKIKTSDSNLKVDSNGIGLSDKITIGSDKTKQVTIDGTKGEISGLTNTTWDSKADYSKSTKAATESQVDAAVKDAVEQAGKNDIHVAAGSYAVNDQNQVSMNLVDKNNFTKGTVIITDVAKSSEMGDVSKLADGVKNAGGKTTTVVDAINNMNTSMNTKIGDQNYSKSNTSGTNKYVSDGDSITSAIGKLDGAVQQAASAAGKHSTVSEGSNIKVNGNVQNDGHTDYKVSLKDDISLNSVTTKSATTDTMTVNKSATIGGVTIANKTISGLDDTKIEKGSTNAVNAGTIWNELRPSGGTYINQNNTTAQNLVSLDTQVKKTSDLINSDGKTIKIGGSDAATKIDVSGKDSSGNSTTRVITGVQTDPQDAASAANVGYVNDVTAASTQQVYRDMNRAYGSLNNNINRAAAGSNALAALHPLDFDPADKASFAFGYGHYRNANAGAFGAFYQPNANTMVNFGITVGNGDPGFNAGVSFKLGQGSPYNGVSKAEMAQTIHDQSEQISAIKAADAAKDKRIDALEKENQEMKKQIQEIMARLNG
nr:YadA-like family protein [uncultured Megasphaera sp.]